MSTSSDATYPTEDLWAGPDRNLWRFGRSNYMDLMRLQRMTHYTDDDIETMPLRGWWLSGKIFGKVINWTFGADARRLRNSHTVFE